MSTNNQSKNAQAGQQNQSNPNQSSVQNRQNANQADQKAKNATPQQSPNKNR